MTNENLTILAIETSCDETAAAVVRGGTQVLSNVVASQIEQHRRYGGVVPEVASRQHILAMETVIAEALVGVPAGWDGIQAIAATYGPGLSGALLTGLNTAKALAFARGLPLIGVNHIEAHIYANWIEAGGQGLGARDQEELLLTHDPHSLTPTFPLIALVVSGGHTLLALLEGHGRYTLLGQTLDDAAGEAFDKSARLLGLGFPGGPAIEQAAKGVQTGMLLPRAWLRNTYNFSFSGLKTAVLHQVQAHNSREAEASIARGQGSGARAQDDAPLHPTPQPLTRDPFTAQIAHAFQESVVDVLVSKAVEAARAHSATEILLAGGVAANGRLRDELVRRSPVPVRFPPISLCTDNAAMVAAAAFYRYEAGRQSDWHLDVQPNLRLA
ncbi:MAG: tRNA (adenosine(37)-N6)-threonylcarbamoyltransferase complex transferase subunit TsaD [Roseiflexaceae bacterium]|nr:tRNA (adenosine(37)-N6)-threonylcarbamoyltransferase complex transferase subunit TsaD [Roseiflexaceae bacterium]